MRDTIELLEAIGRDASLRHASAEELAKVLAEAEATEALVMAVALGDSSRLDSEFGGVTMHMPQISQIPCHDDDDGDGDDDGDDDDDGDCDDDDEDHEDDDEPPSDDAAP